MSRANAHMSLRPPRRNGGFSWGRFPRDPSGLMNGAGSLEYRVFLRDLSGRCHARLRTFPPDELASGGRRHIAAMVLCLRARLAHDVKLANAALVAAETEATEAKA